MTVPTVAPPQDPGAARREAQIRALEAALTVAATAALAGQVQRVTEGLWAAVRAAGAAGAGAGVLVAAAARAADAQLARVRPTVGPVVARQLDRAARLGATHAGAVLPVGYRPADDPRVRDVLDRVDDRIGGKISAARAVLADVTTPGQARTAVDRVAAVDVEARAAVSDTVVRAVAAGGLAAAERAGLALAWHPEHDACLSCQSMAGGTPRDDGLYRPVKVLSPRLLPWLAEGIPAPPAHARCRCHLTAGTHDDAAGIRRDADLAVAYGWSLHDSLPAMLAGVDLLLRSTRLRAGVRRDAVHHLGMGRFTNRRPVRGRAAA